MSDSQNKDGKELPQQGFPDLSSLGNLNVGGLFDGVANLIGKIGELAEKGEQFRKSQEENGNAQTGTFTSSNGAVSGAYGFNVKFGPGTTSSQKVQPFVSKQSNRQNHNTSPQSTRANAENPSPKADFTPTTIDRLREPHVDLFEEADHLLIVAEMPGVAVENVQLEFNGTKLLISGTGSKVDFRREVELPKECKENDVTIEANNGVVEIKIATGS